MRAEAFQKKSGKLYVLWNAVYDASEEPVERDKFAGKLLCL
jgi:hypothetical protein